MEYGVDGSLTHRHRDPHDLIFLKARLSRDPRGCLLCVVDGLQRRIQRIGDPLFGHGKDFMNKAADPKSVPLVLVASSGKPHGWRIR